MVFRIELIIDFARLTKDIDFQLNFDFRGDLIGRIDPSLWTNPQERELDSWGQNFSGEEPPYSGLTMSVHRYQIHRNLDSSIFSEIPKLSLHKNYLDLAEYNTELSAQM